LGLPPHGGTVGGCADQLESDRRSRDHLSANIQNAVHARNATLKISPLLVDRGCEQEIADGVPPRRARLGWESKAEQIGCG
jgi:hypothetical protein